MPMWLTEGTNDLVFLRIVLSACAIGAVAVVVSVFFWPF